MRAAVRTDSMIAPYSATPELLQLPTPGNHLTNRLSTSQASAQLLREARSSAHMT
jgi:hypothetical protein